NKGNGLFIRWVDIAPPGMQVAPEALERRAIFYPDKSESDELIAFWQQKTSRQSQPEGPAHFRPNTSRTARVTFALILAGVALIGWVVITIVQQYPSTSWPSVEGKIISQEYHLLPPGRNTVASAQLKLSYEYQVSGQTYRADRYNLWHQIYQDVNDAVLDFADAHPTNAPIKVYYNPKNPAQAVLVTGPDWSANITLAISGFFLAFIGFAMRAVMLNGGRRQLK
ncbi:MAG TPA: DUF3592 domain-containing protein, partial [Verrucomicrobiae bacterium]|nr:DUF3592 domain-containing protein [Verrucomicrobiae bacterium]